MLHYPIESDVLVFLKHLVESLQPFAKAHSVALSFECGKKTLKLTYHPETVAADILQLICRVVTFTPQNHSVTLRASLQDEPQQFYLKLVVENTGVNLARIGEIAIQTRNPVIIHAENEKSTAYEIHWHLEKPIETTPSVLSSTAHPPDDIRGFYCKIWRAPNSLSLKKIDIFLYFFLKNPPTLLGNAKHFANLVFHD